MHACAYVASICMLPVIIFHIQSMHNVLYNKNFAPQNIYQAKTLYQMSFNINYMNILYVNIPYYIPIVVTIGHLYIIYPYCTPPSL